MFATVGHDSIVTPAVTLIRMAQSETTSDDFIPPLVTQIRIMFGGLSALLMQAPAEGSGWRLVGGVDGTSEILSVDVALLQDAAEKSVSNMFFLVRGGPAGLGRALACLSVGQCNGGHYSVAMILPDAPDLQRTINTAGPLIQLVLNSNSLQREVAKLKTESVELGALIEMTEVVSHAPGFKAAAQILVDDIVERFACEEAALCWTQSSSTYLVSMSHTDAIGRRTELRRLLEEAAAEAIVQGREIIWPTRPGDGVVAAAAEAYAGARGAAVLLIVPLGRAPTFVGAIIFVPRTGRPTEREQWLVRLMADQALPALVSQYDRSQHLLRRIAREVSRETAPIGASWYRRGVLLAIMVAVTGFALTMELPHRVTAPFILKADHMALVSPPFDGYLQSVASKVGDKVFKGQILFTMQTRDLELERANVLADLAQHDREAQKYQALGASADMRVAMAQSEQSKAKIAQLDYRLSTAAARAPIDGVVTEGELYRQIGSPLRKTDPGFRLTALDGYHAEVNIPEAEISFVRDSIDGRISFVGHPDAVFATRVIAVIPQANVVSGENVVAVHIATPHPEAWWRAGMSGIAKLNAGYRPVWWIVSHRAVDFIKMLIWI
eukprot:gene1376-1395_t